MVDGHDQVMTVEREGRVDVDDGQMTVIACGEDGRWMTDR